ncbi:MAG: DUF4011 domain-containing protein [Clostridia bacterium]|nr:DUF4011 domain-containing protein [Clostridia bacterium]
MELREFNEYCIKVKELIRERVWLQRVAESIRETFGEGFKREYVQALEDLASRAYSVVLDEKRRVETLGTDAEIDLYELAINLRRIYDKSKPYSFIGYYFAVSVFAVAVGLVKAKDVKEEIFSESELMEFDAEAGMGDDASLEEKELRRYGVRLLDFSRKNQLVNYRVLKGSSMPLLSRNLAKSVEIIAKSGSLRLSGWDKLDAHTILKCRECGAYYLKPYKPHDRKTQYAEPCPICDADNRYGRKSLVPIKENLQILPDEGYPCPHCGEKIPEELFYNDAMACPFCGESLGIKTYPFVKKSKFALYEENEVVAHVGNAEANERIKTLANKAHSMERNFGLHVLYLAVGFLKWKDVNGMSYESPILLVPVNIALDRKTGIYSFQAEGHFEVNKILIHMLKAYSKHCTVELPSLNEAIPYSYFSELRAYFQEATDAVQRIVKDWEIVEGMGLGLFHYQKLQLEHDLSTHKDKYLSHPVIRRLCKDEDYPVPLSGSDEECLQYMTFDADSSQEEVILGAQKGQSFILQGPPGSGKSQTITNIISTAMGAGKTVLFVTEKASARKVVFDNLSKNKIEGERSLTDFVLDFSTFARRNGAVGREPFVREINNCLVPYSPPVRMYGEMLSDEKHGRGKVIEFMDQMRLEKADGSNYLRLLGEVASRLDGVKLESFSALPLDVLVFAEIRDNLKNYFSFVEEGVTVVDYRKDDLYGCKGDRDKKLVTFAKKYIDNATSFDKLSEELTNAGWLQFINEKSLDGVGLTAKLWEGMPTLSPQIIKSIKTNGIDFLISTAKERRRECYNITMDPIICVISSINEGALAKASISKLIKQKKYYKFFLRRMGQEYKDFLEAVFSCFNDIEKKPCYNSAKQKLDKLVSYVNYMNKKAEYEKKKTDFVTTFGSVPTTVDQWDIIINALETTKRIMGENDNAVLNLSANLDWLDGFSDTKYAKTVKKLISWQKQCEDIKNCEEENSNKITSYFYEYDLDDNYPYCLSLANLVVKEKERLAGWYRLMETVGEIDRLGLVGVLDELIEESVTTQSGVVLSLERSYYEERVNKFVEENALHSVPAFDSTIHQRMVEGYATSDKNVLSTGAHRLYQKLAYEKKQATMPSGKTPIKMQSKNGYSIKKTITENWHWLKKVKPCFMMSPLNVSQYIDVDNVEFDLVIFDEASQIFTEDALASIARGKQVIIAGDSKQLPPCDFFKVSDLSREDDNDFVDDEEENENSLLLSADVALKDSSIALRWHYRSCDEALIAFSNEHFNYNLITFPSATKNPNDGIQYEQIAYTPSTCYVSGKSGSHVNKGEAQRIVELIWEEMNHPERKDFSIGVVAFSNAQAEEIEESWERFKETSGNKDQIVAWEEAHKDEPIMFCNLDTVQGDERDTMLVSICYSQDSDDKFYLTYLGRVRLPSGKKRINVAITRSRHRMIVVSTLTHARLNSAIRASSGKEENKEGAIALSEFLKYAESFALHNSAVTAPSTNPFVLSVCKVLEENGIKYSTEIGRSECKINVGICAPQDANSFVLGIVIDDPRRLDFDSPREYARLTEQVLSKKYNWTIYKIYPISWVNDFENEKNKLLLKVNEALGK